MMIFDARIMALEMNASSHNPVLSRDLLYINYPILFFAVNTFTIVFNVAGACSPRMIGKE